MSFDLACAGLAVLLAFYGLIRGLVRQVFGILGFVGGIVLARMFSGPLAEQFHQQLGVSLTVAAVGFSIVLFFATELAARLVGSALHSLFGLTPITGGLNRLGGLIVGFLKGGLLVWALASLGALLLPNLGLIEKRAPWVSKLDLEHSQAVALAKDQSALGDKAKELRARTAAELKRARARR